LAYIRRTRITVTTVIVDEDARSIVIAMIKGAWIRVIAQERIVLAHSSRQVTGIQSTRIQIGAIQLRGYAGPVRSVAVANLTGHLRLAVHSRVQATHAVEDDALVHRTKIAVIAIRCLMLTVTDRITTVRCAWIAVRAVLFQMLAEPAARIALIDSAGIRVRAVDIDVFTFS
jgi:hypothetical protein